MTGLRGVEDNSGISSTDADAGAGALEAKVDVEGLSLSSGT